MTTPTPTLLGETNHEARDNLETLANVAFQRDDLDAALKLAHVASLYAIAVELGHIEASLDNIADALHAGRLIAE